MGNIRDEDVLPEDIDGEKDILVDPFDLAKSSGDENPDENRNLFAESSSEDLSGQVKVNIQEYINPFLQGKQITFKVSILSSHFSSCRLIQVKIERTKKEINQRK